MGSVERISLNVGVDGPRRILWRLGWNPKPTYALFGGLAICGWLLMRHPFGLLLSLVALIPQWKSIGLINRNWQDYLGKAESTIKEQGAVRLGVNSASANAVAVHAGQGKAPFLITPKPEYAISVVYICEAFFAVYQGAVLRLREMVIELPAQGEEVYFRHVSAVNYNPPNIEVILSNGKSMRKFDVGAEGGGAVLGVLRAKLREPALQVLHPPAVQRNAEKPVLHAQADTRAVSSSTAADGHLSLPPGQDDERCCYLRLGKLKQLIDEPTVLEVLLEHLEVPGEPKTLKALTPREKMESIKAQVDHFRRTPTSVWYGTPMLEILAASIWRASECPDCRDRGFTRKLVRREWFCGVSEEDDLRIPVAKWLKNNGYEPYMEIPLGSGRADVLGIRKATLAGSRRYLAVELKNDYEQFKRALNQMSTFAEYTNGVYMACTPDFAAEYLDHNEQSTGHWDRDVLGRRLTSGGFGLLIVERDQVFELIEPIEKTPPETNSSKVAGALSTVNLIEC